MGKEIDNHVAKLDLDSSGFLKGAEEVLKAIGKLETALEFKGAEKGFTSVADAVSSMQARVSGTLADTVSQMSSFTGSITQAASTAVSSMNTVLAAVDGAASSVANSVTTSATATAASVIDTCQSVAGAVEGMFAPIAAEAATVSQSIESSLSGIGGSVSSQIQTAASAAEAAVGAATTGISAKIAGVLKVVGVVAAAAAAIGAAVALASSGIGAKVSSAVDSVKDKITKAKDEIKNTIDKGLDGIKTKFKEVGNLIKPKVDQFVKDLKTSFQTAFPETSELVGKWATQIGAKFEELKSKVQTACTNLFSGVKAIFDGIRMFGYAVIDELKTRLSIFVDGITGVVGPIVEKVQSFAAKISSHFRKNKEEVDALSEGAAQLSSGLNDAVKAAQNLETALSGTLGDTTAGAEEAAASVKDISAAFETVAPAAADTADSTREVGESAKESGEQVKEFSDETKEGFDQAKEGAEGTKESTDDLGEEFEETGEQAKEFGDESKDAFDKTGDSAEKSGNVIKNVMGVIGAFANALGKDLGGLPFRLDEIADKGGKVGQVLSSALQMAGDKTKDLALTALPLLASTIGDKFREITGIGEHVSDGAKVAETATKAVGDAAQAVGGKFSAMGAVAFGALERIGQKALDTGTRLLKSLSVDNISQGWNEYGLKINSTQTIMASTGEILSTVNGYLEELNKYADRTIYSFSDMTQNIGKFTNAGVSLEDAVAAIKGISNEAALSGANANEASRSMYNFAQALSAGYVKLIDWKSIENANMATKGFKEQLIQTAVELKTVKKTEDGYISTTKDANGHISSAFTATKNFNDSLSAQWMTTEVLTKTLAKYANETTDFGKKAYAAAQDIKTGAQLMDTLKEAVGSGWSRTFELIIGNLDEAKQFWTGISNMITPIIDGISNARNGLLEGWKALGGREDLLKSLKDGLTNVIDIFKAAKEGLEAFIPPMTAIRLKDITDKIGDFIEKVKLSDTQLDRIKDIFAKIGDGVMKAKDGLKQFFEPFKDLTGVQHFKDSISALFHSPDLFSKDGLISAISAVVDKINSFVQSGIIGTLREHIGSISTFISTLVATTGELIFQIGTILGKVGEVIGTVVSGIASHLDEIMAFVSSVISLIGSIANVLGAFIRTCLDRIQKWIPTIQNVIITALNLITVALEKLGGFLDDHVDGVATFIEVLLKLKAIGKIAKVVVKVASAFMTLYKAVGMLKSVGAIAKVIETLNHTLGLTIPVTNTVTGLLGGLAKAALSAVAPVLGIAAAVAAVTAAATILSAIDEKLRKERLEQIQATYGLTEAQKTLIDKVHETREEYDRSSDAHEKMIEQVNAEERANRTLVERLRDNVDATGKVKEGKETLVQEILDQLNDKLGTELKLVDGQVEGYDKLNQQLDGIIQKKAILAKVENGEEEYNTRKEQVVVHTVERDKLQDQLDTEEKKLEVAEGELDTLISQYDAWQKKYSPYDTTPLADVGDRNTIYDIVSYDNLNPNASIIADKIDQIRVYEANINGDGTEENPGLKQGLVDAEHVLNEDKNYIQNYEKMKDAAEDTSVSAEDAAKAAVDFDKQIKHAGQATLSELQQQRDDFQAEYYDALNSVNKGNLDANDPYVEAIKTAYLTAAQELAKGTAIDRRKNPQKDGSILNDPAGARERALRQGTYTLEPQVSEKAKAISKQVEESREMVNSIRKAAAEVDKILTEAGRKGEAKAEAAMAKVNEGLATGLKKSEQVATDGGDKSTGGFVKGLLGKMLGIVPAAAAELPETAAKSATENAGVMQKPGAEGVNQYAGGVKGAAPVAEGAGQTVTNATNTGMGAVPTSPTGVKKGEEGAAGFASTAPQYESGGQTVVNAAISGAQSVDVYNAMHSIGENADKGLISGMESLEAKVAATAMRIAGLIPNSTTMRLEVSSPSRLAERITEFWGEGLVIGMENMERAVKSESITLSETLVSGATTPLSSLSDILSGEFDDSMTITPVMDLSQIQNDASRLRDMLDGARVSVGRMDISGIMPDYSRYGSSDDRALNELKGLRKDMADFNEKLTNLQVRMDTGALVGTLASPMDGEHSIRFYPDENYVDNILFDKDDRVDCPDTWERWHLIPTGKVIFQPPEHKQNLLEIPGRHGFVNANKYTFGRPVYGARTGEIEFVLDPDYIEDWPAIYSDMMRYLHGQERCAVLRDDRYFYYKGFFDVSDLTPDESWDTVKLSYKLDPFKYERWRSNEKQLWDDFDFRQGTLRDYGEVLVDPGVYESSIILPIMAPYDFQMPVVPSFIAKNYDEIVDALTATGAPLAQIFDLVSSAPVGWPTTIDPAYGSIPDFDNAYVTWQGGQGYPDPPSDPSDHSAWPAVIRKMLSEDWPIDAIGTAAENIPDNTVLEEVAENLTALLGKLYSLSEPKSNDDAEGKAMQLKDIEELLPSAAAYLYRFRETAAEGIVQASIDHETWFNVFAHQTSVSYDALDVSRCNILRDGTKTYVYLRRGFDSVMPKVSVSMRGGTL